LSGATPSQPGSAPRASRRERLGPANGRFVAAHLSAGVGGTLLVQTATYALASRIGHTGHGLGPVIGAAALGAFAPPILNYTIQWAAGRAVAPGRDRFWAGFLVRQFAHLGIFAGALLGGVELDGGVAASGIIFADALVSSGLATMTAELGRRPLSHPALAQPASASVGSGLPLKIVVPVLELQF
jgi:hypothetical protein